MRIISYIIAIILVIFGLTFALLNASPVTLNYYIGTTHISLSLLLVITIGIGILIGLLASLGPILKLKRTNYRLKSRLRKLEQEVINIKVSDDKGLQ